MRRRVPLDFLLQHPTQLVCEGRYAAGWRILLGPRRYGALRRRCRSARSA